MAYTPFSKLILALLLVASTLSIAYSARSTNGLINGILPTRVAEVNILGRLVCSATGNIFPGANSPGIAGVDVNVSCNGGQLSLGTLTTNATGFFDGLLKTGDGILFDPSNCVAQVKLPIVSCTLLPPTGILRSLLRVGSIIDTILGLVASLLTGTWQVVH